MEKVETCELCGRDLPDSEICEYCGFNNHRKSPNNIWASKRIKREMATDREINDKALEERSD